MAISLIIMIIILLQSKSVISHGSNSCYDPVNYNS